MTQRRQREALIGFVVVSAMVMIKLAILAAVFDWL